MAVEPTQSSVSVGVGANFEAVVSATDVTRRYGHDGTGVDALRGVSLAVAAGRGRSGDGAVRIGQVDVAAHPRRAGSTDLGRGVHRRRRAVDDADRRLTLLRRHKVGFVFQFFNLLPMLSAEQNIVLPLKLAGATLDAEWVDHVIESVGIGAACAPTRGSSRWSAAARSDRACADHAAIGPVRGRADRATSTQRPVVRSWICSVLLRELVRADDPHRHARAPCLFDRRSDPAARRRTDRRRARPRLKPGGEEHDRRARVMTGVILRGLATRKLRAALTAIAIVLGVAMISGTYVLMDTTMHAFDNVFTTAYANAGAVVVGKSPITGGHATVPPVPAAAGARIRALPQVAAVQGFIDDRAEIRDAKGAAITGPGTPLAFGVPSHGGVFNTLTVVTGHLPSGEGQVALDASRPQTTTASRSVRGSTCPTSAEVVPGRRDRALRRCADARADRAGTTTRSTWRHARTTARQLVQAIQPLRPASAEGEDRSRSGAVDDPERQRSASAPFATCCSCSAGSRCSSDRS